MTRMTLSVGNGHCRALVVCSGFLAVTDVRVEAVLVSVAFDLEIVQYIQSCPNVIVRDVPRQADIL